MDLTQQELGQLLTILGVIISVVLVADIVIIVQWLLRMFAIDRYQQLAYTVPPETGVFGTEQTATSKQATLHVPKPYFGTWNLAEPFLAFQLIYIIISLLSFLAMLPLLSRGPNAISSPPGQIILILGLILTNVLFVVVTSLRLKSYGLPLSKLGLGKPTVKQILLGLGLGIAMFLVASLLEVGSVNLLKRILPVASYDSLMRWTKVLTADGMFTELNSLPLKILLALAGAIAAPIGEEVFFRGWLYNAFKAKTGVIPAIIFSGLIFAVVHGGPLAVLIIFPMGMLIAATYEKTKSLWVVIAMHAANNALAFGIMLFSK